MFRKYLLPLLLPLVAGAQTITISPRVVTAKQGDTVSFTAALKDAAGKNYTSTATVVWGILPEQAVLAQGRTVKLVIPRSGETRVVVGWVRTTAPKVVSDTIVFTAGQIPVVPVPPGTKPICVPDTVKILVPGPVVHDTTKITVPGPVVHDTIIKYVRDSSVVVVPPPVKDTQVVVTPPPVTQPSVYRTIAADSVTYSSTAQLQDRISSGIGGTGKGPLLYTDGVGAVLAQVDNTVKYNGHNTIKYQMPAGGGQPELWVHVPDMKHFWMRAKVRWQPGFTTTGDLAGSSNAYKVFGFGFNPGSTTPGVDGSGRLEITNTTQYQIYFGGSYRTGGSAFTAQFATAGNIVNEWNDGKWYDYIIEVDLTRQVGVARVWMAEDGKTPVLRGTSSTTFAQTSWATVNYINWGMNFNQHRTQSQAIWYGQWEVVDGNQYAHPFGL